MKNPIAMMRLLNYKTEFFNSNPEFYKFLVEELGNKLEQGTTIKIQVTNPNAEEVKTEIEIKEEDLKFIEEIKNIVNIS